MHGTTNALPEFRRPLAQVRAEIERSQRDDDFADVAGELPHASLIRAAADRMTAAFVARWYDGPIRVIAGLLQARQTLTADQIRAAIGRRGG